MGDAQVVLTTDGTAKILAAVMGKAIVLATGNEEGWGLPPGLVYDLWGARPENPEWHRKLAKNARIIVYWNTGDFDSLSEMYPGRLRTVAEHMGSVLLASLYSAACPTMTSLLREQELYARLPELGLPQQMNVAQTIPFDPTRKDKLLVMYPELEKNGLVTTRAKIAKNPFVRAIISGETMMVENTGQPIMPTGRALLALASLVMQYAPDGRMNVQSDGRVHLDPAALFARDAEGNVRGGGTQFCMGGVPITKPDFSNAETIDLNQLF